MCILVSMSATAPAPSFRVAISANTKANDAKNLESFKCFITRRPAPFRVGNYKLKRISGIDEFLKLQSHVIGKYLAAYFRILRPGICKKSFKAIDVYDMVIIKKQELDPSINCYKGSSFRQIVSNLTSSLNRRIVQMSSDIIAGADDSETIPGHISHPDMLNFNNPCLLGTKKVYFIL